jgi:endogenous inhibitor of DNA gyrase (YacG/DUF329 family)
MAMSEQTKATRAQSCPICGKPTVERLRPFCSSRCADVDLSRWLHGVYAIPADETDDEARETDGREAG